METEVADGSAAGSTSGAIAGLAAIDPTLAKLVEQLEVTKEELRIPDRRSPTTSRRRASGRSRSCSSGRCSSALRPGVPRRARRASRRASCSARSPTSSRTATAPTPRTAYLWALVLVVIAVGVGFVSKYFRIFAQRFNQSVIVVLRRRVFYRLSKLGVNYYDRELPGDVATRVVADLDKILAFVAGSRRSGSRASSRSSSSRWSRSSSSRPACIPVVLVLLGLIIVLTAHPAPVREPGARRGRATSSAWSPGSSRRTSAPATRSATSGAHAIQTQKFVEASWERRRARWWAITLQNTHTAVVQFLGTMTTALVLYQAGHARARPGADHRHRGVGAAARHHRHPAAPAARPALQPVPRRARVVATPVRAVRRADPSRGRRERASRARRSTGPSRSSRSRSPTPTPTRPVLHDVSFTMEPGKVTALVGYTGAGQVEHRQAARPHLRPRRGRGHGQRHRPPRPRTSTRFRPRLGIVPQDPFVFKGTVASNIRYAKPGRDRRRGRGARSARSARGTCCRCSPAAFEHVVEEEGHNLTAAQRQLIALARAWLAEPDILVLDESTSLLDTDVEDIIVESVHELGCTTLMITHRESVAVEVRQHRRARGRSRRRRRARGAGRTSRRSLRPPLARPGRRARRREGQGARRGQRRGERSDRRTGSARQL